MAVLEELLLLGVELTDLEPEFLAKIGDRNFVEQKTFEDGDLLGAGKVTTQLLVHQRISVQVILTRTERSSRFD